MKINNDFENNDDGSNEGDCQDKDDDAHEDECEYKYDDGNTMAKVTKHPKYTKM